ncbi:MAG: heavy metal-associated domain-containing protein [Tetrasphaera sp.]
MTTTEYSVTGMTCGHCEQAVREEVSQVQGVESLEVSAAEARLVVTSTDELDDDAVVAAVEEAGYHAKRV